MTYKKLDTSKIEYLIIHHTATPLNATYDFVKQIGVSRGFGDISYNFLITSNGEVHKGRPIDSVPAHCVAGGMNYKSLGIALTGDFTRISPTKEQLESLEDTIITLMAKYNIPKYKILSHCEVSGASTLCPGILKEWIIGFREDDIKNKLIRLIQKLIKR
jgi:N-acetyl-anhydromuramyl-L-alanine amidase AmpD